MGLEGIPLMFEMDHGKRKQREREREEKGYNFASEEQQRERGRSAEKIRTATTRNGGRMKGESREEKDAETFSKNVDSGPHCSKSV